LGAIPFDVELATLLMFELKIDVGVQLRDRVKLERRFAICALLFGTGFAANSLSFLLYNQAGPLTWVGVALEVGSLAVWWLLGRAENEWVDPRRWRTIATLAMVGGTALIMLSIALISFGGGTLGLVFAVVYLGAPFLGAGLLVAGAKLLYDLRGGLGASSSGF
jgi:hypothetical protein